MSAIPHIILWGGPGHGQIYPERTVAAPTLKMPVMEDLAATAFRDNDPMVPHLTPTTAVYHRTDLFSPDGYRVYQYQEPCQLDPTKWSRTTSMREWVHESGLAWIPTYQLQEGKMKMFCGYCHGSHDNEVQLMRCQTEKKEMDLTEPFWTPESIVGYRGFSIEKKYGDDRYYLRGVKTTWKTNPAPVAECLPIGQPTTTRVHDSPIIACMCGYYMLKDPDKVGVWSVEARVEAWGTVIEHELGYRAEKMRILAIRPGESKELYQFQPDLLEDIAREYGVELHDGDW